MVITKSQLQRTNMDGPVIFVLTELDSIYSSYDQKIKPKQVRIQRLSAEDVARHETSVCHQPNDEITNQYFLHRETHLASQLSRRRRKTAGRFLRTGRTSTTKQKDVQIEKKNQLPSARH